MNTASYLHITQMPKRPWAQDEQLKFLEGRLPEYCIVQPTKDYQDFWPQLYQDWFETWSERKQVFPEKAIDEPLTDEEEVQLGTAIKACREVYLIHW